MFVECNKICNKYNIALFVNTKINVAIKLNCKRIQLSFTDFLNNQDKLNLFDNVAVSVHSLQEARCIEDYIYGNKKQKTKFFLIAGHIFETDCKKNLKPRGTEFLKEICNSVHIPVFAIGGINEKTIKQLEGIKVEGVCLMSTLMKKSITAMYNLQFIINDIELPNHLR